MILLSHVTDDEKCEMFMCHHDEMCSSTPFSFPTVVTGGFSGYYGGKGLPFFWTTIPGVTKTDENKKQTGQIAKNAFSIHKTLGVYGKYLVPLHVAGAVGHAARGHTIFARMNPFRTGPKH
jgi:cytochrome b561